MAVSPWWRSLPPRPPVGSGVGLCPRWPCQTESRQLPWVGPGLCIVAEALAWLGSWNHIWRSCSLGHLLRPTRPRPRAAWPRCLSPLGPPGCWLPPPSPVRLAGAEVRPWAACAGLQRRIFQVRNAAAAVSPRMSSRGLAGVRAGPPLPCCRAARPCPHSVSSFYGVSGCESHHPPPS